jgi:hypothetical protein
MCILHLHVLLSLCLVKTSPTEKANMSACLPLRREGVDKYNTTQRKASKYTAQIGVGAATWQCMSRARS